MGFNLEAFFEELRELLDDTDMKASKKIKELDKVVSFWAKYAEECGEFRK